jgi:hypothetical protein
MKKIITIFSVLFSTTLGITGINSSIFAYEQKQSQIIQTSSNTQKPLTLLAQNSYFIDLAQQADTETGLALEKWRFFYREVVEIGNNGGNGDFSNVIALSQQISQHHLNAARITSQMYEIAPNSNYEKNGNDLP